MLLNPSSPLENVSPLGNEALLSDAPLSIDEARLKFLQFLTDSFNELLQPGKTFDDIKSGTFVFEYFNLPVLIRIANQLRLKCTPICRL